MRTAWWSSLALGLSCVAVAQEPKAEPRSGAEPEPAAPVAAASSAPAIPTNRLVLNDLTVFRYNALGLETQIRFGYQRRLMESDSLLFRDTFVFVGLFPKLNPAYAKVGPGIEIQPAAVFNLRVVAEYVGYFSTFGYLQSFGSPLDNYADSALSAASKAKANYASSGLHVTIEPLLQAKVGPVAVRNKLGLEYWNLRVRSTDTVFYDATADTLIPANGWVVTNDLDVLYQSTMGLTVGARYSAVWPLYGPDAFRPGEDATRARNSHHRVGLLGAYTFYDEGFSRFNKPTILAIVAWYVDHRFRTGADVSRAIPYFVLGFAFQSDFWQ